MYCWLLTSTCYGNWLPGDGRGSVTNVIQRRPLEERGPRRRRHNSYGSDLELAMPALKRSAASRLKCLPIRLDAAKAKLVLSQFEETATRRGWRLVAVAIMSNHFHVVMFAADQIAGGRLLADLKAYGSRRLNSVYGTPASGTWWTSGGSTRRLVDDDAIESAIDYVLNRQSRPLITWSLNEPPTDKAAHSGR